MNSALHEEGQGEDPEDVPFNDNQNSTSIHHKDDSSSSKDRMTSLMGVAGNVLEWYDFSVFGYFSDIISTQFFPPDQSGHAALIESFAVFGSAFLVRPIGGLIIGRFGDVVGRKAALEGSILLMAFPTFVLGCLPTYGTVGWISTILLIICRLLQGLSVGGQLMSSVVFTLERSPRMHWGVWGAAVFAASSVGVTFGSLLSYVLREMLSEEELQAWGWRVPFWLGVLGIIPGWYLKRHGKEHPVPAVHEEEDISPTHGGVFTRQSSSRLSDTFTLSNIRALISMAFVGAVSAATYYIVFIWLAVFMESLCDPPVPHAFAINSVSGFSGIFIQFFGGWVADQATAKSRNQNGGRKAWIRIMAISAITLAVTAPPFLATIGATSNPYIALLSQLVMGTILSMYSGCMLPWMIDTFPPAVRMTSMGVGYNISVSIFGGFAPAMATLLVDKVSDAAPGYVVTITGMLSVLGLCLGLGLKGNIVVDDDEGCVEITEGGAVITEVEGVVNNTRPIT
eukprot:CAMPEP_0195507168 /NCGR_PEP_ID=MMETSP0794_2-20130614/677_1 /TAXON_ID=515487 /ORGANISM="Stephanopyxis turris, Strain CCMP 815" /LENGTH=509 /DNA_ID=CAMNT_0040633761 /DNA_START=91 /DNA_END=1620 /DNA_ORIENTATION=+